jgi:hypothetical protein
MIPRPNEKELPAFDGYQENWLLIIARLTTNHSHTCLTGSSPPDNIETNYFLVGMLPFGNVGP